MMRNKVCDYVISKEKLAAAMISNGIVRFPKGIPIDGDIIAVNWDFNRDQFFIRVRSVEHLVAPEGDLAPQRRIETEDLTIEMLDAKCRVGVLRSWVLNELRIDDPLSESKRGRIVEALEAIHALLSFDDDEDEDDAG